MATNTTKLNLPKPDASDNFNRAAYNGLIDAIDANVGAKLDAKIETSKAGAANGVATLDPDGKVPASQLNVSAPAVASTTQKGVVQLSSATDSTSEILAATPKAVKDAKDGLTTQIGILSGLNTTAKTNLVAAVNELFTSASNGKTQIASAITGKGVAASSSDTFPALATKIGQISNSINGQQAIAAVFQESIAKSDPVYINGDPVKLANPSTLPTASAYATAFSPDGMYLAVGVTNSLYPFLYKRSGDTFTKLANPASSLPAASVILTMKFSPDGTRLMIGTANNSGTKVFQYIRSGDVFTLTSLAGVTLPSGDVRCIDVSSDGVYWAFARTGTPYVTIIKLNGDGSFSNVANPSTLPAGDGFAVSFSQDTNYLAVSHTASPYMTVYKRTGDTFNKLANPTGGNPTTSCRGLQFSPDGTQIVVTADDKTVQVFGLSNDVLTKLPNADVNLPYGGECLAFHPSGSYVVVGCQSTAYLYKRNGSSYNKMPDLTPTPDFFVRGLSFSGDGVYMSVASSSGIPYIHLYKRTRRAYKSNNLLGDARYDGLGYALESGINGQEKQIALIWR